MRDLGRIRGLGVMAPTATPVVEIVGGVAGAGLLIGGAVVQKTPGLVMMILGGITILGSGISLVMKMAGPPGVPAAPPPLPPVPPPAPKAPAYAQYAQYAQAALPVVNQLFSKLFGAQPAMMVVHSRR